MDKLFRKRTGAKGGRKGKAKAEQPPMPPMPPSLKLEIRNSLIMPSMSERFSVLLPSMTAAPENSLRNLLEQQRARGQGPSLTQEEEDMLVAEIQAQNRPRAGSNVSSEWDGNPPQFHAEWMYGDRSQSVLTHSSSNPSLLSTDSTSPRKGMSPSSSAYGQAFTAQGGSVMDRTFTRSYGFTGSASFRDNNYIRSVEKEKEKQRGNSADDGPAWEDPNKSPSYRGKALPTVARPTDASSKGAATLHPDSARTTSPSGSERTVTPTPSVQAPAMSHAAWSIPRPATADADKAESSSSPQQSEQQPQPRGSLDQQTRPRVSLDQQTRPRGSLDQQRDNGPVGTTSSLRQRPVDARRGQRQSLLMNMSPQQAKRISVALLEIETHLRQSAALDGVRWEDHHEEPEEDDQEEVLDWEPGEEAEPERRPSVASSGGSTVFPFAVSPASTSRNAFSSSDVGFSTGDEGTTSPPQRNTPTASPRFDVAAQVVSPASLSPDSQVASSHVPSPQQTHAAAFTSSPPQHTSQFTAPPQQHTAEFASPTSPPQGPQQLSRIDTSTTVSRHAHSSSIASTAYSEEDYARPALVPTRPQPARAARSPSVGATSPYIPGQPRPVGSNRQASFSSMGSTPTSPMNSQSPGAIDSLAKRLNYPAVPGARPRLPSLARSLSEQHHNLSQNTSRSQTPTPAVVSQELAAAPGARHQTSLSFSDNIGSSWRAGSSNAHHSPPSQLTISEEEPSTRPTPQSSKAQTPSLKSIKSREPSPAQSKKHSPATQSPSLRSLSSVRRADSVASVSSTWTGPNSTEENVWDRVLNGTHTPQAEPQSCVEEDNAELELLKSMSGLGKEELSLIQECLVEKAKSERDRLRAVGETAPADSPATTHSNPLPSTPPNYLAYLPSPDGASPDPQSPLAALAMLPGHIPGMPPQPVDPSELPQGPPPPRPAHPSDVAAARTAASTPSLPASSLPPSQTQSPTKNGHGRGDSKARVWLDDDPEAKRDIEKRIADATSDLFRAPSRSAHKRSLSKSARKQISTPRLVSYSATVPTVPITGVDDSAHKRNSSGENKPKRKLSLRWKRKGKKSAEGTPPPPTSMPIKLATPNTQASTSVVTTPASAVSNAKSAPSPTPASRKKSDADLNGFRFPNAPSSLSVNKDTKSGAKDADADSSKNATRARAQSNAATPLQTPTRSLPTVAQVVELSKKTHKPSGSEDSVAFGKFFEAGRAVGLSEVQLQDMLRQNASLNRSGTNTSSRSHGSTAPTSARSHGQSPQPGSPRSGTVHLGNGVKLQPPASLARNPTPVVEKTNAPSIHSVQASNDMADFDPDAPVVVSHTVIMAEDVPGLQGPQAPLQAGFLQPQRRDKSPTRSNSIRRKPVQITEDDRDLLNRSPKSSYAPSASSYTPSQTNYPSHQRNVSGQSGHIYHQRHASQSTQNPTSPPPHQPAVSAQTTGSDSEWALPPRQFDRTYDGTPDYSGSARSSAQGSIYDYYGGDSLSPDRASTFQSYRDSGTGSIGRGSGSAYGYAYGYPPSRDSEIESQSASQERPSMSMERPSMTMERPSMTMERPSMAMERPSFATERPSLAMERPSFAMERPSLAYERPSMAYERPSMSGDRSSQAVEITEYSDGKVVWNLVNALRDDAPRPSLDVDPMRPFVRGGSAMRDSIAESFTESLVEEDLPWRVGPTPTPAFMRRPDTRVYYTSSADVADLIDQLSSDLAGAARGRIDIRPTSPGGTRYDEYPSIEERLDPASPDQPNYQHQPLQYGQAPSEGHASDANPNTSPGQFSNAPSPLNVPPRRNASLNRTNAHAAYQAGVNAPADASTQGTALEAPPPPHPISGTSWTGSDLSGQGESVQDRLQALMDRLRSAPGGIGKAATRR